MNPTAWFLGLDYCKVYCNTCQLTYPVPALHRVEKVSRAAWVRRIPCPDVTLPIPETPTTASTHPYPTSCLVWLLMAIPFICLTRSPLRSAFCLPHIGDTASPCQINPHSFESLGAHCLAVSHLHVNPLLSTNLGKCGWWDEAEKGTVSHSQEPS